MNVALIYPPSCDPTAPYLSLPTLTAWLRTNGVDVMPIDANLEAWESLLARAPLEKLRRRVELRLARLEKQSSLSHDDQLLYATLWRARGEAADVPRAIDAAIATLRDRTRFYDDQAYEAAVATIEAAQRVVSAAFAPTSLDFVAYRTPFSLLTADEIARDACADRDPFHEYFASLADRIDAAGVKLVGISVAFPGQVQPAFSLAYMLRARCPGVHVTVGGPALTQMLLRLKGELLEKALGPFHSAVVYEGEVALLAMARAIERGEDPAKGGRVIKGTQIEDMGLLPPPDFDGLPLDRYLAPELVLPYDPTRGCYWGVCTFCHYGLAEVGTARYRERPEETVLDHLASLKAKHAVRIFYFSQDVFSPRIASRIARGIRQRGLDVKWGTDMRPEKAFVPERCEELVAGGMLSTALGVESANPRVLSLIDKGISAEDVKRTIQNLSRAGVAVEAMCFTEFPTETYREAMESVRFVDGFKDDLSLFILGRFDLTHGALVAQRPGDFGIKEVWQVDGDELGTGLFYAEKRRPKSSKDRAKLEEAVAELSRGWRLHRYPWAGALSTAHTMLWYAHHGKDVFRNLGARISVLPGARVREGDARFDVERVTATAADDEAAIWEALVHGERCVRTSAYHAKATRLPHASPAPSRWRYTAGHEPLCVESAGVGKARGGGSGRRPSHAGNAMKS
jgi:anaerobic magnesium-protoporphyrin IX monomethyl ester cyclase